MIPGCILSGGNARRIGGKGKSFIKLSGKPLISHAIKNIKNQVSYLSINSRDIKNYSSFGYPILLDEFKVENEGSGPLAGIITAINWAKKLHKSYTYVATIPVDLPFIPKDFIHRMLLEVNVSNPQVAIASSNGRRHPVTGLWSLNLYDDLQIALSKGIRKIDHFLYDLDVISVDWKYDNLDPFFNINTPEDLSFAEKVI